MRRIAKPLAAMGATVELPEHGGLPMTVRGAPMRDIEWVNETGSAQVKSCIMFAALCGGVEAKVVESPRSRDHTERMLASQGVDVWVNDESVLLHPASRLAPLDVTVPGDPSSAAFFAALAALAPDGELLLRRVCVNETRTGFLAALAEMGADIELLDRERLAGEWVADVRVKGGATLRGISIGREAIPTLIDELPLVACLATYAEGETRVTGAEELRVKESDRIAVVVGNLRALGADVEELPDGFVVRGTAPALRGRVVDARRSPDGDGVRDPRRSSWQRDRDRRPRVRRGVVSDVLERSLGGHRVVTATPRTVIAIDGPAASGKSSTAQWVAERLEFRHVDSGSLYRGLTAAMLRTRTEPDDWTGPALVAQGSRVALRPEKTSFSIADRRRAGGGGAARLCA